MTQKKLFFFFFIILLVSTCAKSASAESLYGQTEITNTCVEQMDGNGLQVFTVNGMSGHVDKVCWYGSCDEYTYPWVRSQTTNYNNGTTIGTERVEADCYPAGCTITPDDCQYFSGGNGSSTSGFHNLESWHCYDADFDLDPDRYYRFDFGANIPYCGSNSSSAYYNSSYDSWAYGGTWYQRGALKDMAWSFGDPEDIPPVTIEAGYPQDADVITDFSTWWAYVINAPSPLWDGTVDVVWGDDEESQLYVDSHFVQVLEGTTPFQVNIPKSRLLSVGHVYNATFQLYDSYEELVDSVGISFEIKNGAYYINDYYAPPPTGTSTPVVTCDPASGFFNESICKMMLYLFSPDPDKYNDLVGLKDELNEKAPFAYFTLAKNLFSEIEIETGDYPEASVDMVLFNGATTSVPLMTFESDLVSKSDYTQVRTMFGYVVWLMFLSYLFARPLEMLTNKK
jgi:hypothetical protein